MKCTKVGGTNNLLVSENRPVEIVSIKTTKCGENSLLVSDVGATKSQMAISFPSDSAKSHKVRIRIDCLLRPQLSNDQSLNCARTLSALNQAALVDS